MAADHVRSRTASGSGSGPGSYPPYDVFDEASFLKLIKQVLARPTLYFLCLLIPGGLSVVHLGHPLGRNLPPSSLGENALQRSEAQTVTAHEGAGRERPRQRGHGSHGGQLLWFRGAFEAAKTVLGRSVHLVVCCGCRGMRESYAACNVVYRKRGYLTSKNLKWDVSSGRHLRSSARACIPVVMTKAHKPIATLPFRLLPPSASCRLKKLPHQHRRHRT